MSAFDYSRLALTAQYLIARFGVAVTLATTTALNTTATRAARAVFVDRVRHLLGDSGVEIGDWRVLFDADAAPLLTDRLTRGSESYVLVQVEPIQPAGTVLAWQAWARAG